MAMTGKQTDNGDGTKRVQVWDENHDLIYDMTGDVDAVFTGPVEWSDPT
jgi:hypothetical protein